MEKRVEFLFADGVNPTTRRQQLQMDIREDGKLHRYVPDYGSPVKPIVGVWCRGVEVRDLVNTDTFRLAIVKVTENLFSKPARAVSAPAATPMRAFPKEIVNPEFAADFKGPRREVTKGTTVKVEICYSKERGRIEAFTVLEGYTFRIRIFQVSGLDPKPGERWEVTLGRKVRIIDSFLKIAERDGTPVRRLPNLATEKVEGLEAKLRKCRAATPPEGTGVGQLTLASLNQRTAPRRRKRTRSQIRATSESRRKAADEKGKRQKGKNGKNKKQKAA